MTIWQGGELQPVPPLPPVQMERGFHLTQDLVEFHAHLMADVQRSVRPVIPPDFFRALDQSFGAIWESVLELRNFASQSAETAQKI